MRNKKKQTYIQRTPPPMEKRKRKNKKEKNKTKQNKEEPGFELANFDWIV